MSFLKPSQIILEHDVQLLNEDKEDNDYQKNLDLEIELKILDRIVGGVDTICIKLA